MEAGREVNMSDKKHWFIDCSKLPHVEIVGLTDSEYLSLPVEEGLRSIPIRRNPEGCHGPFDTRRGAEAAAMSVLGRFLMHTREMNKTMPTLNMPKPFKT